MAVGATCAFAANPFVDVPSGQLGLQIRRRITDAGIIRGVDGSVAFVATVTSLVMKPLKWSQKLWPYGQFVEQRALINKLADEYADELNNLGVRVSALENRVGNVKLTGDARIRYINQSEGDKIKADNYQ